MPAATARASRCWARACSSAAWTGLPLGGHNVDNALAAIAAARMPACPEVACARSASSGGIKRRMELRGEVRRRVYDDFAHHPTAITTTIDGCASASARSASSPCLEPRSNTMKLGVHRETLAPSLAGADEV